MDIVSAYAQLTQDTVNVTGMSRPMLHMLAGMAIYLPSRLFLGAGRGSLLAIMLVLQAELGNELLNVLNYGTLRWSDTIEDITLTLLGPVMLCCFGSHKGDMPVQAKQMAADQAGQQESNPAEQARPKLVAERIRSSVGRTGSDWDRSTPIYHLPLAA
jgi:hypothetical protein